MTIQHIQADLTLVPSVREIDLGITLIDDSTVRMPYAMRTNSGATSSTG